MQDEWLGDDSKEPRAEPAGERGPTSPEKLRLRSQWRNKPSLENDAALNSGNEDGQVFDDLDPNKKRKRKDDKESKRIHCSQADGFWMCGRKYCPAKFIAWLPLCVLLIVFSLLFLTGLLIAFFLTNTTFALLDQEDTYSLETWKSTDPADWYLRYVPNDTEFGEILLVDVQVPIVTYVPSLIPIRVVHYGLSVRYTPLTAISQKTLSSVCLLNNLRLNRSVNDTTRVCQPSENVHRNATDRGDKSYFASEPTEWLPFASLLDKSHRRHLVGSYTSWMDALLPTSLQNRQLFGFLPKARRTSVGTLARWTSNATNPTRRQGYVWPVQVARAGGLVDSNTIEVSWETVSRRQESKFYSNDNKVFQSDLEDEASAPIVLDVIEAWNSTKLKPSMQLTSVSEGTSHHHVPRWRRRRANITLTDGLTATVSTEKARQQRISRAISQYKYLRKHSPRDIRLNVRSGLGQSTLGWWITSLLLTRMEACFEEARQLASILELLDETDSLPRELQVGNTCGEHWVMGAALRKRFESDGSAIKLIDGALLALAAEDVTIDFTFPAKNIEYEDPLRAKTLPKGQSTLPTLKLYIRLPIAENPTFYAAIQEDCNVWGMVLLEVRFEDAYPCEWCSLVFRPHTYRYQFVALCWAELVP